MSEPIRFCTQMILPENLIENADFSKQRMDDSIKSDSNTDDSDFDFGTGGYSVTGKDILWKPGQIITIGFVGGTQQERSKTREYAEKWLKYANIEFLWLGDEYQTMIRVAFDHNRGTWSYVGTDCLLIPGNDPTMNLGRLQSSLDKGDIDDARYVVVHEFAHMLGMQHEQHNSTNNIPWNKEAMYQYHAEVNGWTRDQVDRTYFSRLPRHNADTPYDKHSIMHYPVENRFTHGNFEVGYNYHPSEGDQAFMRRAYPAT